MRNQLCKYLQALLLGGVATDYSEIVATGQERDCCNQFWVGKSTLKPPDATDCACVLKLFGAWVRM